MTYMFESILIILGIDITIRFFEHCENRQYKPVLKECLLRIILTVVLIVGSHGAAGGNRILKDILFLLLYVQAYYDIKQQQVYCILTNNANKLLWLMYLLFNFEYGDIEGILVFLFLNILFCKTLKSYAAGDMRILFAVLPVLAIEYTGINLAEKTLLLFVLMNIVFIVQKLYDRIIYKKKLAEPKEFVPAIFIAVLIIYYL